MASTKEEKLHRLTIRFIAILCFFSASGFTHAFCIGASGFPDIVISNELYIAGEVVDCDSPDSITFGPDVTVPDGVIVDLDAPNISLGENVALQLGSEIHLGNMPCVSSSTIVCMGLNTEWPGGTLGAPGPPPNLFLIPPGVTHVWSFPYLGGHFTGVGSIGTINGTPKRQSISLAPGYFSPVDNECSNMQATGEGSIAFEPAPGSIFWRCDLVDGTMYYHNLKNESATPSYYKVVIF